MSIPYILITILIGVYKPSLYNRVEIELIIEITGAILLSSELILPIGICIAEGVSIMREWKKKREAEKFMEGKKRSAVKRIYKTTDGYFSNRPDIKKPRNVAVIEQRKDDGAVAVVKIFSKDGKEAKIGTTFIPDLTLTPEEHKALTEDSVVGREVIIGVKRNGKAKPQSIYPDDLNETGDKLNKKEFKIISQQVQNAKPEHRETYEKKMKRWRKHFKE